MGLELKRLMPKVEANQSRRQEVIAEKQGLTGSEIHSSHLCIHLSRKWPLVTLAASCQFRGPWSYLGPMVVCGALVT